MQRLKTIAMFAVSLGLAITSQGMLPNSARAAELDKSLKATLDKIGYIYTINEQNNFKIVISFQQEGRKQTVYINSGLDSISKRSVRRIYSYPSSSRINDDKTLDFALSDSVEHKIGSWEMNNDGDLMYVAKVDANLSGAEVAEIVGIVASKADDLEVKMGMADEK